MRWWDGETGRELYHYALPSLLNTTAAPSPTTPVSSSVLDKFIANQISQLFLLPLPPPPHASEPNLSAVVTPLFHVIAVTREQNFHVFSPLPTVTPVTLYVGHNDEIIDVRFIPTPTVTAQHRPSLSQTVPSRAYSISLHCPASLLSVTATCVGRRCVQ